MDTVMQAYKVFVCRTVWSMIERDIGREAFLALPKIATIIVGGHLPVGFFQGALQLVDKTNPGCLAMCVMFETNSVYRLRKFIYHTILKFLPTDGTQYHWTSSRTKLCELLDVDEGYIPDHILYPYGLVSATNQLCSEAAVDDEWAQLAIARNTDVTQQPQQKAIVKNTFIEVADTTEEKRSRAYSAGEDPAFRTIPVWGRPLDDTEGGAHEKMSICQNLDHIAFVPAHVQVQDEPGGDVEKSVKDRSPTFKCRGGHSKSGWTRQRRSRALQKMQAPVEDAD